MTVLVACETLLLVALSVLVVGLLRSHAEILRRLGPPPMKGTHAAGERFGGDSIPQPARRAGLQAGRDIVGLTPNRDGLKVALGAGSPPTLLAFLSSGCKICEGFWEDLRSPSRTAELHRDVRLLAVTKGLQEESPSRIRALAPEALPVVMSSEAWAAYRVPAAPYFVYLENGLVRGKGSASSWVGIVSLLRDAIEDHPHENAGEQRAANIDHVLLAAGIGPGHPSLYPGTFGERDRPETSAERETP